MVLGCPGEIISELPCKAAEAALALVGVDVWIPITVMVSQYGKRGIQSLADRANLLAEYATNQMVHLCSFPLNSLCMVKTLNFRFEHIEACSCEELRFTGPLIHGPYL